MLIKNLFNNTAFYIRKCTFDRIVVIINVFLWKWPPSRCLFRAENFRNSIKI